MTSVREDIDHIARILDEINGMFKIFNLDGTPIDSAPQFVAVAPERLAAERFRFFLADPTAYSIRRTVPVREGPGDMSILTPVPLPLPARADHVDEARWCVDVLVGRYSPPPRTGLASRVFLQDAGGIPEAIMRAGLGGVTFGSANMGFIAAGTPREGRLANPLLRLPGAGQIFTELASARSAAVQRSDAGRRAANAVELWGSLEALQSDLKGSVRRLLDGFLPPVSKRDGSYSSGYAVRSDGYLTYRYAVTALGHPDGETRSTLDRLIMTKVLRRGLILNCQRCRWQAFYRVEEFGPSTFACAACGYISDLSSTSWAKNETEPVWHYSLDQVVRDLLRQHGDVPLLAVDQLAKGARSVLWSPELVIAGKGVDRVELVSRN